MFKNNPALALELEVGIDAQDFLNKLQYPSRTVAGIFSDPTGNVTETHPE